MSPSQNSHLLFSWDSALQQVTVHVKTDTEEKEKNLSKQIRHVFLECSLSFDLLFTEETNDLCLSRRKCGQIERSSRLLDLCDNGGQRHCGFKGTGGGPWTVDLEMLLYQLSRGDQAFTKGEKVTKF